MYLSERITDPSMVPMNYSDFTSMYIYFLFFTPGILSPQGILLEVWLQVQFQKHFTF